ncbi:hypothetical protein N7451_008865 [Penicillium sp. IBT 35674x]|nr:hypothetical protein N7451_008865 [Penicillium sp. IBT 35674x]
MDGPNDPASAGPTAEQGTRTAVPDPTEQHAAHSSPVPSLAVPGDTQALAADPFEPVLETLQRLEREDPKLASQGARLLGFFRRVWESCLSKHVDIQRLEEANQILRAGNAQHSGEADHLKHRQDDQLARLHAFESALERTRQNLLGVLDDWNSCAAADLAVVPDDFP